MGIFTKLKNKAVGLFKNISKGGSGIFRKLSGFYNSNPVLNDININHRIHLLLAKEAYQTPQQRRRNIMGYQLDEELNTKTEAVYINNNNIIIASKGTNDLDDIKTDIEIIKTDVGDKEDFYNRTNRQRELLQMIKKTRAKYPNANIELTGHSLSGKAILEALNINRDLYGISFNPGGYFPTNKNFVNNSTIYIAGTDPLSFGYSSSKNAFIVDKPEKPKGFNHSINYFL